MEVPHAAFLSYTQGCAFACEFRKIRMRCENFAKFRIRIASQSRFQIRIIFAKCEQNFRMRKIRIMRNCRRMRLFACEFFGNANLCEMRIFAMCEFSQNANLCEMRIFAKCEFSQNANLCEMRIFAKCEFPRNANLCEMRTFAFDFSRKVRNNIIKKFSN